MSGGIFKQSGLGATVLTEADFADEVGEGLVVEGKRPPAPSVLPKVGMALLIAYVAYKVTR